MLNYFASLYFGMVLGYAVGIKQMEGKIKQMEGKITQMEGNWQKKENSYKDIISDYCDIIKSNYSDKRVLEFGVETNKK